MGQFNSDVSFYHKKELLYISYIFLLFELSRVCLGEKSDNHSIVLLKRRAALAQEESNDRPGMRYNVSLLKIVNSNLCLLIYFWLL